MTLIVALLCREGLVLASDSQATYGTHGQETRGNIEKIFSKWTNLAWGASGDGGLTQRVDQALTSAFSHPNSLTKRSRDQLREDITEVVADAVGRWGERVIKLPNENQFLFVSHATDGPLILEIPATLSDVDHTFACFAAIGSQWVFPNYAMRALDHFNVAQRSLLETKMTTYRIMDDAIRVASDLSPPIQMIELRVPGSGSKWELRQLTTDDVKMVEDQVVQWKLVEAETLSKVAGFSVDVPDESES